MNFGLISYGAWGSYHAEAIAQDEGTEMMAIAFKSERTYQKARGDYPETAVYRDYKPEFRAKCVHYTNYTASH